MMGLKKLYQESVNKKTKKGGKKPMDADNQPRGEEKKNKRGSMQPKFQHNPNADGRRKESLRKFRLWSRTPCNATQHFPLLRCFSLLVFLSSVGTAIELSLAGNHLSRASRCPRTGLRGRY